MLSEIIRLSLFYWGAVPVSLLGPLQQIEPIGIDHINLNEFEDY